MRRDSYIIIISSSSISSLYSTLQNTHTKDETNRYDYRQRRNGDFEGLVRAN